MENWLSGTCIQLSSKMRLWASRKSDDDNDNKNELTDCCCCCCCLRVDWQSSRSVIRSLMFNVVSLIHDEKMRTLRTVHTEEEEEGKSGGDIVLIVLGQWCWRRWRRRRRRLCLCHRVWWHPIFPFHFFPRAIDLVTKMYSLY